MCKIMVFSWVNSLACSTNEWRNGLSKTESSLNPTEYQPAALFFKKAPTPYPYCGYKKAKKWVCVLVCNFLVRDTFPTMDQPNFNVKIACPMTLKQAPLEF